MTTKAPMFAMTMVYNENHNLQRWINYYGVKVGLEVFISSTTVLTTDRRAVLTIV